MTEKKFKIGERVKCIDEDKALDDLSLEEFREESDVFQEDIYEAISMKTCGEKRLTLGAPGREAMKEVLKKNKKYLDEDVLF